MWQEGPRQRVVMKQNRNVGEMPPSDSDSEEEEEAGTRRLLSAAQRVPLSPLSRRSAHTSSLRAVGEGLQRVTIVSGAARDVPGT